MDETLPIEIDDAATGDMDVSLVDDVVETSGAGDGGMDAVPVGDAAAVMDDAAVSPLDNAWRTPYESLGFKDIDSPEQAQTRMIDAYRQRDDQLREAQERIRYMQSLHSRIDNLSGGTGQSPAAPAGPTDTLNKFSSEWVVPNLDLVRRYVTEQEGEPTIWNSDAPLELRKQVDAYHLQKEEWKNVLDDPRQLDKAINERVERMLSERLEGVLTERDTRSADQQAEQKFFTDNDWLFARDPVSGGAYVDPMTGKAALSPDGQQFFSSFRSVRDSGVSRVTDQLNFALALHRQQQTQARQAPTQQRVTAQPTVEQKRAEMLGRTNKTPARPTTSAGLTDGPGASRTGAKRESFGASLVAQLVEERVI